jgi:oxygen-independent coproporphyrinogen-3 oxidase
MEKELGIYIHIPFCKHKCYYCDFTSFAKSIEWQEQYINALKREIKDNKDTMSNYHINTIYIGGGTPSYIDSKHIVDILEILNKNCKIDKNAEITIEINPGTVSKEKLEDYKKAGINRLSIGLQSTNNNILKEIGRIHTYEDFIYTYTIAREIGFTNINVDLMLALPKQTEEILIKSVDEVIKLEPEHISIYSLILEEGTYLQRRVEEGKAKLPDDETERKMYWKVKEILEKNQYIHYEISNFAKMEMQSKHNVNCWNQKEYIGFGVSAHSYINKTRYSNTENLEKYINSVLKSNEYIGIIRTINEVQTVEDEQKEYMMLGLRKIEGISISEFKNKFIQNPIYIFRKELDELTKKELIEIDKDNIKLTKKGLDFANIVWEDFT